MNIKVVIKRLLDRLTNVKGSTINANLSTKGKVATPLSRIDYMMSNNSYLWKE